MLKAYSVRFREVYDFLGQILAWFVMGIIALSVLGNLLSIDDKSDTKSVIKKSVQEKVKMGDNTPKVENSANESKAIKTEVAPHVKEEKPKVEVPVNVDREVRKLRSQIGKLEYEIKQKTMLLGEGIEEEVRQRGLREIEIRRTQIKDLERQIEKLKG